jgi:uncharacterized membrane protein
MSKTLKLLFLTSVTLNVLFLGVLLGQLPQRFRTAFSPQARMEAAIKDMPEPARSRIHVKMDQMFKETQPLRDQIQKVRNETIGIFIADPFDEAAYDRHVSQIDGLRLEMAKRFAVNMKEIARELPAAQRKKLAEAFERPPRGR